MRIGMMTSWGMRCGVANYTRLLLDELTCQPGVEGVVLAPMEAASDEGPYLVSRCWRRHDPHPAEIVAEAKRLGVDLLHIQYQPSFLAAEQLCDVATAAVSAGIRVAVTIHALPPRDLDSCGRWPTSVTFIVHREADLGSIPRGCPTAVIPIGNIACVARNRVRLREQLGLAGWDPIIAGFGFLQPHKGTLEIVRAMPRLVEARPNALFLASSALQTNPESLRYLESCRSEISRLDLENHVVVLGRFLDDDAAMVALQVADVVVLPYKNTSESASGSLGFALASGRPVITTKQPIFEGSCAPLYQIESATPSAIAEGVIAVLEDADLQADLATRGAAYAESRAWPRVTELHLETYRAMLGTVSGG